MKKIIIIALCCVAISAKAQVLADPIEGADKKLGNSFKFSITNFFDRSFQFGYERKLCKSSGLFINAAISYRNNSGQRTEGYKGEIQYKYFVYSNEREKSGENIYFAPYFLYKYAEGMMDYYPGYYYYQKKSFYNSFAGGVLFGANFIIAKKIVIDAYVGGGIKRTLGPHLENTYNMAYYNNSFWDAAYNGISPKVGIDVGFRF